MQISGASTAPAAMTRAADHDNDKVRPDNDQDDAVKGASTKQRQQLQQSVQPGQGKKIDMYA